MLQSLGRKEVVEDNVYSSWENSMCRAMEIRFIGMYVCVTVNVTSFACLFFQST